MLLAGISIINYSFAFFAVSSRTLREKFLSIINYQLSIINYQLSIINYSFAFFTVSLRSLREKLLSIIN